MTEQPPPDAAQPVTSSTQPAAVDAASPGPLVDWTIPEARPLPGHRQIVYADIPNRVIAYIVDIVALVIIVVAIELIIVVVLLAGGRASGETGFSGVVFNMIGAVLSAAYFLYGWSRRATIGMRWLGLQIGNAADGATLTMEQGIRRFVALFGPGIVYDLVSGFGNNSLTGILGLVAFVWFIYLLVDTARSPTKQGLHDRFANSLIVKVTRAPA